MTNHLSIVVEDLGYTGCARYTQLTAQKIFFVTRQKRNARYEVREYRRVNKDQGLPSDQTIRLTGVQAQECPVALRRIAYRDAASGRRYVVLATLSSWRPGPSPRSTRNGGRSRSSSASSNRT